MFGLPAEGEGCALGSDLYCHGIMVENVAHISSIQLTIAALMSDIRFVRAIILFLLPLVVVACTSSSRVDIDYSKLDRKTVAVPEVTELVSAAANGSAQGVREALASGAQLNAVAPEGSAFSVALRRKHSAVASFLLGAGANWRAGFAPGQPSALMVAARNGDNRLVKQLILKGALLDYQDDQGYTALAVAALEGHLTTMKVLINAGADVDAVAEGRSVLMHVVNNNNVLLSQLLIKSGADVNYQDDEGDTALKIARRKGYFDLDLMLVQAGARF